VLLKDRGDPVSKDKMILSSDVLHIVMVCIKQGLQQSQQSRHWKQQTVQRGWGESQHVTEAGR
jgi:hypothetical protein